jgi:hypothetical protein
MDASFQAGSNDTIGGMSDIGGWIYHRLFMAAAISARTYVILHTDLYLWGEGG